MAFGQNVRTLREHLGFTQKQLADKIGISQSTLAQYELGSKVPSIMVADIIANIFKVTCDDLVHGDFSDKIS